MINQSLRERGTQLHFTRLLANCLNRWNREHPNDAWAESETNRLLGKFRDLADIDVAA